MHDPSSGTTRDDDSFSVGSDSSRDSLFDADSDRGDDSDPRQEPGAVATIATPPIPGLFILRSAIPLNMQHQLAADLSSVWPAESNQVMLFSSQERSALPSFLDGLLALLPEILKPLPEPVLHSIFHSTAPRQVIFNLYHPGTGISPHIDLPHRYEDGIVGISVGGSAAMDFTHEDGRKHSILIRPGDVYVLSGEARWQWQHGIAYRTEDVVQEGGRAPYTLHRRMRMSITLRRMKAGADLLMAGE